MKPMYHENQSRGLSDHGWLKSRHTFSFADYYNPESMNFGLLRVLNDDIVTPSMGFGTHPHENMEIISIPLSGALRHQDSMGNKHIISTGEVQIMSAGRGITHSEYNDSSSEDVNFLQIWVLPKERDITPRYDQKFFDEGNRKNRFQLLVAPENSEETVLINQDAWFSLADIEAEKQVIYEKNDKKNGVYFFVIEGSVNIDGNAVKRRDGLGIVDGETYPIVAQSKAQLLAIEVPLVD
ncbi:pirin family protein [Desulfogranum marinum]|uniref:pirin family protein n=1 Tax=Desulfogranum marinum TaxID=453220 RepID=UPI0019659F2B|nr:pirin family protein [Desulfogranum marinum]MBM9515156.1 pirin family protein [Desulfogranum marinum]